MIIFALLVWCIRPPGQFGGILLDLGKETRDKSHKIHARKVGVNDWCELAVDASDRDQLQAYKDRTIGSPVVSQLGMAFVDVPLVGHAPLASYPLPPVHEPIFRLFSPTIDVQLYSHVH
jgi:hypothetical protein